MSQFYWNLVMTNTSSTGCTLTGYPRVILMSATSGKGIGAPAGREPGAAQTDGIVALSPGASGYSLLHLSQAGVFDCRIVAVTEVAVTPPSGDVSLPVATPNRIDGCDDLTTELVRAGPVTAAPRA
jgi:hypothetical protein